MPPRIAVMMWSSLLLGHCHAGAVERRISQVVDRQVEVPHIQEAAKRFHVSKPRSHEAIEHERCVFFAMCP